MVKYFAVSNKVRTFVPGNVINMEMSTNRNASERLYEKYEYLAKKHASKIYSYEELSYEYEDLLQEFKIKIFTSIKAYGRRYLKYKRGEAAKPVPIKYYLEAACSNKARDFMKYIGRENHKVRIDSINYDFGIGNDTEIDTAHNRFIVKGVDLLFGLHGKERAVFSLFLRGYKIGFLNKVYFSNKNERKLRKEIIDSGDKPFGPVDIIEMQRNRLISKFGNDLLKSNQTFATFDFED